MTKSIKFLSLMLLLCVAQRASPSARGRIASGSRRASEGDRRGLNSARRFRQGSMIAISSLMRRTRKGTRRSADYRNAIFARAEIAGKRDTLLKMSRLERYARAIVVTSAGRREIES